MRVVRQEEIGRLASTVPADPATLIPHWLEGPFNNDRLDVGFVTASAGAVTPPHIHIGGQVIVVMEGRGFVETDGERILIGPGDVVISPPGELHCHGAAPDQPIAHLTITTGGYTFPAG